MGLEHWGPPVRLAGQVGPKIDGFGFSPDGSRLVTHHVNRTVVVWETRDGNPVLVLPPPVGGEAIIQQQPITRIGFSADGRRIIAHPAFGPATVWDSAPVTRFWPPPEPLPAPWAGR